MKLLSGNIVLSEDDLKEIFSLFSSTTKFEKKQVYDEKSEHYFRNIRLSDEYSLTEERREFALDAWRAVISFLNSKGYSFLKDGKEITLSWRYDDFID